MEELNGTLSRFNSFEDLKKDQYLKSATEKSFEYQREWEELMEKINRENKIEKLASGSEK